MSLPILTAVSDPRWESDLTAGLSDGEHGVRVVRRCVDLADLLAAASAGLARAVVLSADLRRLDRDALTRLGLARVAVVGLVAPGDEAAEQRLRQLGVGQVLAHDAPTAAVSDAVLAAVGELGNAASNSALDWADPASALPQLPSFDAGTEPVEVVPGTGRLIAVWGPAGAPGRTTVAVNLAAELCGLGYPALLVDADSYSGVVAQLLGVLDAADVVVGVAAADPVGLARYLRTLPDCVALSAVSPLTVVNRLRRGVVGPGDPRREVRSALDRYAGIRDIHPIPEDRDALDTAMAAGRTLAEVAPKSAARAAIRDLAAHLAGEPALRGRRSRQGQRQRR